MKGLVLSITAGQGHNQTAMVSANVSTSAVSMQIPGCIQIYKPDFIRFCK